MAKLKSSFLKNSLQLFCYKNVLNENIYSKYDNCLDDDIESTRNDINENKRKLTTQSATSGKYSIVPTIIVKHKNNDPNDTNSPKKLQNIYIHYSENTSIPDLVSTATTSSPKSNSPKSPQSKLARQNEQEKNDNKNLPDIIMISDAEAAALDVMKRKGVNNKKKNKTRSKSINTVKTNTNSSNPGIYYNRARILSPIPALSAITPTPSESTPISRPSQSNDSKNLIIRNRHSYPIPNKTERQTLLSAPATFADSSQSTPNKQPQQHQQNFNRQSYPPDSTLLTQANTLRNRSCYTQIQTRTPLKNLNMNENTAHANNPTTPDNTTKPLYNRTRIKTCATTKPSTALTPSSISISIGNANNMPAPLIETDNTYDNTFNRQSIRYQSADTIINQTTNNVKMRQSRLTNREADFVDKTKRSLSAISTTSTKKSVRFADSVGLELENILNLSTLDNSAHLDRNRYGDFYSNENTDSQNKRSTLRKLSTTSKNSNTIHINLNSPLVNNNENTINYENLNFNDNDNSNEAYLSYLNSHKNPQQSFVIKTLKLANLTIRTRINTNGKLESEV